LFVPAFLNFFDDPGTEGLKVSWVAGRDDPLVDDALALGISITCCVVEGYAPVDFLQNLRGTNQIRINIAFMSRDQMSLTLNANALVENLLFPDLDSFFGRCGSV
jgi:hypothetical protein